MSQKAAEAVVVAGGGRGLLFYGMLLIFVILPLLTFVSALTRKLKCPEKSWKFCLLNAALRPIRQFRLSLGPINYKNGYNFDKACQKAMDIAAKKYKIQIDSKDSMAVWGKNKDHDFMENYRTIYATPTWKTMKFHNIGLMMANKEMNSVLIRRLQFVNFLKLNPDIEKISVPKPCFVIGLPRTGTTWLSRCLAMDPKVHAPKLWELLRPVPENQQLKRNTDEMMKDRAKRQKEVKMLLAMRKDLGDSAMDHIHEVDADNHEECLWAMSDDMPIMMHQLYTDYMEGSVFFSKMDNEVAIRAYEYYKKQLQLLIWQRKDENLENPTRLLLKSPLHLFYMKALGTVFKNCNVVWTHREPVSAVPSMGSLLKGVHQLYFEPECRDDHMLGKNLNRVSEEYLKKCPEDIASVNLNCKHVYYGDTTTNIVETIKGIYKHFGWEFTSEYEQILINFDKSEREKRNKMAEKKGATSGHAGSGHKYEPEEFGLTKESFENAGYKAYKEKYCINDPTLPKPEKKK